MERSQNYREPGVAGSLYSRDKIILEREMSMMLEAAQVWTLPRPIRAIIVPHDGYLYSGGVAARAFSQILNTPYQRVIIVAPSHRESFPFNSIFNGRGYQTPFGEIPIDDAIASKLVDKSNRIRFSDKGHSSSEHAVEVQLPFLQWCLGKFKMIPIVMGEQTGENINDLSGVLSRQVPANGTLLVASSVLSDGYSDTQARAVDQIAIEAISNFDDQMLWREIQEKQAILSGGGPVIAVMQSARNLGAREVKILLHRNSGDISGNTGKVTGYLSAVIY